MRSSAPLAFLDSEVRSAAKLALYTTIVLRIFYSGLGILFAPHLTLDPVLIRSNRLTDSLMAPSDRWSYALFGVWERFDTLWYVHISQCGYDRPESVVFFPLYPCLVRLVTPLCPNPVAACLLVSTAAAFFVFWGFYALLALDLPAGRRNRAFALFTVWPATMIFFAGYIEALDLALMLWSVYFARTGRWWAAGLTGAAAGLAKAVGFLVVVPAALLAYRKRAREAVLPLVLTLAGTAAFPVWLLVTGRILPSTAYRSYWTTLVSPPWQTLWGSARVVLAGTDLVFALHVTVFSIVCILSVCKSIRPEYLWYSAAAILFLLTKNSVPSQQQLSRYVLILFPAPANLSLLLSDDLFLVPVFLCGVGLNFLFLWNFMSWRLII